MYQKKVFFLNSLTYISIPDGNEYQNKNVNLSLFFLVANFVSILMVLHIQ